MKRHKYTYCFGAIALLLLFCSPALHAQGKMEVISFTKSAGDNTASTTAPRKDQNGEICAIIKIKTTVKDLMFEPDALGITARQNQTEEIWLYVPHGARRISILHDKLGILRNYFYPERVEAGTVYEMALNTGEDGKKSQAETNMQLLILRPEPATADVYIDDEQMPIENGLFTATMIRGEHTYRIEAPMYEPQAGVIDLGREQIIMSVSLKPKFGYLEIFSLPEEGANVYIDTTLIGKTPYRSDRMKIQEYKIRIEKELYHSIDTTINIVAGETIRPTFHLRSTIKKKEPLSTLIMLQAGFHTEQTTFGAMVGFMRKSGYYVGFRSDFGSVSAELEADENGVINEGEQPPYYKEDVKHKARLSVTAGYIHPLKKNIYLYAGAGYGQRTLAWETTDNIIVKSKAKSCTGVAAEVGGLINLGKIVVSANYHTVNFKHHEIGAGIGVIF